uniref:Uncharacterized protein n=1 Tax=Timema douglasi TaxID=61478 RepID=A0A7R8Z4G9_TIMDO|nr:unnamed protein product [Timema douglasi]
MLDDKIKRVDSIKVTFMNPFHHSELDRWISQCYRNNDLKCIVQGISKYSQLYILRDAIIEKVMSIYGQFFTFILSEEKHCCLVKCENLQLGLTYFVGEWKIEGSTCSDSMKHDFIFELLPKGTSLDVHFRNTLMELCKKDNWELYTLKKLWLKLGQMIVDDADKISSCSGSHATIFCPLIRPLRRVAIDEVARPRRHLVGFNPFEGRLSVVVVWTDQKEQVNSIDEISPGVPLSDLVTTADQQDTRNPRIVEAEDRVVGCGGLRSKKGMNKSELLLGRPQAMSLTKLTLSETLQQVSQGCELEPSRWETDKGSLEWNSWRFPELEMLAGSGLTDEKGEDTRLTIEHVCEYSTQYGILSGLDGHLDRSERSQGHQGDLVDLELFLEFLVLLLIWANHVDEIRVVTGIGRCSDWCRDLVASGKSNHGAEITLFISDLVVNHVRRDVMIKLRLEGIIQEYSEATSGGKIT